MATVLSDFGEFTLTAAPGEGLWLAPDKAAAATRLRAPAVPA